MVLNYSSRLETKGSKGSADQDISIKGENDSAVLQFQPETEDDPRFGFVSDPHDYKKGRRKILLIPPPQKTKT
ncbi:hypothetical protein Q1695_007248 [Nippostrongylus brasiliensis]|nr:hypothetical protein Q1695_007248 [Nippostrongylus brasiliensis]